MWEAERGLGVGRLGKRIAAHGAGCPINLAWGQLSGRHLGARRKVPGSWLSALAGGRGAYQNLAWAGFWAARGTELDISGLYALFQEGWGAGTGSPAGLERGFGLILGAFGPSGRSGAARGGGPGPRGAREKMHIDQKCLLPGRRGPAWHDRSLVSCYREQADAVAEDPTDERRGTDHSRCPVFHHVRRCTFLASSIELVVVHAIQDGELGKLAAIVIRDADDPPFLRSAGSSDALRFPRAFMRERAHECDQHNRPTYREYNCQLQHRSPLRCLRSRPTSGVNSARFHYTRRRANPPSIHLRQSRIASMTSWNLGPTSSRSQW